jgi:hypothetical protein
MRVALPFIALTLVSAAVAAKPPTGEERLAKTLAGTTPGKPQSCFSTTLGRADSQTIEGVGILYKSGRTYWLNRFEGGCPQLDQFSFLVTRTPTGQFCRGDIAQVVSQGTSIPRGSCIFGDFTPYTRAK